MFKLGGFNGARAVFSTSGFRFVVQFTSSATNSICSNFMVDYLVNSLGFSKDETIVTSSKDLGLSGSDLADIISMHPGIFRKSLNHIVSTLEALKSVVGDNISLVGALKMSQWMLAPGLAKNLPLNVALLQKYELSAHKIGTLLSRNPRLFVRDPEYMQAVLIKVEERLQIRGDSPMFYHAVYALYSREEIMESRI